MIRRSDELCASRSNHLLLLHDRLNGVNECPSGEGNDGGEQNRVAHDVVPCLSVIMPAKIEKGADASQRSAANTGKAQNRLFGVPV
jgi:hypothetical protein